MIQVENGGGEFQTPLKAPCRFFGWFKAKDMIQTSEFQDTFICCSILETENDIFYVHSPQLNYPNVERDYVVCITM